MKTNIINVKTCSFVYRAAFAAILATSGIAHAQTTVTWDGGTSGTGTNITSATNWTTDTLPTGSTVGIINTSIVTNLPTLSIGGSLENFNIQQDAGTVNRTASIVQFSNTTYTLNSGAFNWGNAALVYTNSTINVKGGAFTLGNNRSLQGAAGTAILNVSGGSLTLEGNGSILGNNSGSSTYDLNISGGTVSSGATGRLSLARATDRATITGGTSTFGSGANTITNGARMTFGLGNGTVSFASELTIGGTNSFVDFLTGSGGALSITGFTSANYASWWDSGFLRINGVAGAPGAFNSSDFLVTDSTLTLVPEPSTWALLAVSLTTLAIFRRRLRRN